MDSNKRMEVKSLNEGQRFTITLNEDDKRMLQHITYFREVIAKHVGHQGVFSELEVLDFVGRLHNELFMSY